MRITQMILYLENIKKKDGDLEIFTNNFDSRDNEFFEELRKPSVVRGEPEDLVLLRRGTDSRNTWEG
jgi:hypothetical protein